MTKISTTWVIWLVLGLLLAVDASPQFSTSLVTKTLALLKPALPAATSTPTVVNCMTETSASLVSWQNPDFPKTESLPGICTLTLNPARGTCAYRLSFDDLDLMSKSSGIIQIVPGFSCNVDEPYIQVSTVNYTAPARCQNLTGYEGIVQLPKNSAEPVILLMKTDPNVNFSFRVTISSVACTDIKSFKSPNVCGIKNQFLSGSGRKTLRAGTPKEADSVEATLEESDTTPVEITETVEEARKGRRFSDQHAADSHRSNPDSAGLSSANPHVANTDSASSGFRRLPVGQIKKKHKNKTQKYVKTQTKSNVCEHSDEAKDFVEKLKEGNILSQGLGAGIEQCKIDYNLNKKRVSGRPTNPNEWPWMVYIEFPVEIDIFFDSVTIKTGCNGALVDESHVITAASCLPGISFQKGSVDSVRVILGDHDVLNQTDIKSIINTTVSKITFPMSSSAFWAIDDIAVLTLSEPVTLTDAVRPVCLPVSYNRFSDDSGVLSGWSAASDISPNSPPSIPFPFGGSELNALEVKVLDASVCNETISFILALLELTGLDISLDADDFMCVTDKVTESSVCDVGIGTPLVRKDVTNAYFLYGISSVFQSCGSFFPSIFTAIKLDDAFLNLALAG